MRKFLSLVLALAMTMSLVVVSSSAKEFTDDDELNYEEAVAVISEIGVVDGYADGSFNPQGGLTRGAAAKIICNLILGPTTAAELHADTRPFPDVAIDSEFAGYIAYCAQQGIISGYADGEFKAANPLTGYAFMKMLLGALGYDSNNEGYVGENWSINVAKQALGVGLNAGLKEDFNGVDYVTREEAALYAFNTLKATLVDYETKITATVNGAEVTVSNGTAYPVGWDNQNVQTGIVNDGNIKADQFVQFAEEYFPDLVGRFDTDDFERPATLWTYEKQEIGTYVRWEKLVETYTTGVTGQEIYELLTSAIIKDNDVLRYVDGGKETFNEDTELVRSNKNDLDKTGNGVLTEVYLDTDRDEIRIISVNTWLAQATSDYNESTEIATVKIYDSYNASTMVTGASTQTVDVADVPEVVDLTKDEFVLVNQSIKDRTKLQVVAIAQPEILEDCTVTAFSKNNEDDKSGYGPNAKGLYKSVTTGGEKYDGAVKGLYDASVLNEYDADLLKDNSYNVYLDPYGYVIGVDLYEGTKNYVFITGYNRTVDSNISVETSQAAAIFLDGTMKTITVNVKDTNKNIEAVNSDSAYAGYFDETLAAQGHNLWVAGGEPNENKWYTYTVTDAGVYTLKPVKQQSATAVADIPGAVTVGTVTTGTIDCSRVYLPDSYRTNKAPYAYGDDESVYIVVSQGEVDTTPTTAITDVDGVYTGVQEVKIEIDSSKIHSDADTTSLTADLYHVDPVYTVYNGDGYVIASVVIGEAQGANKNYAYILSGATMEEVRDGVTYWQFDAVMGGKKQTLTIQDKFGTTIQELVPNTVQELMFSGDYVTKIKAVTDQVNCALQQIDAGNDDVYDITFDTTRAGTSTNYADYTDSAYQQPVNAGVVGTDNTTITLQTRTLYTTRMANAVQHAGDWGQTVGLTFVADAPAVVIQMQNNKKTTTEYASVSEALGAMADANTTADGQQFRGRIVAVLNDLGVAEWVVFISATPVTAGTTTGTPSGAVAPTITVDKGTRTISAGFLYDVPANARYTQIALALNSAGVDFNFIDPGLTYAIDSDGKWWPISVTDFYRLTVNNNVSYIQKASVGDTTLGKVVTVTGTGTGYVLDAGLDDGTALSGYQDYTSKGTLAATVKISDHVTITSGYVKVPTTATTGGTGTALSSATVQNTGLDYVPYGGSLTVDVTYNQGTISGDQSVALSITGGTPTVSPASIIFEAAEDDNAAVTKTFTISNITADITAIAANATAYTAPVNYKVTVKTTDNDLCGLTVDSITVSPTTVSSDAATPTATVTIYLTGTVATTDAGVSLVASATDGASQYNWNPGDAPNGSSVSASGAVGNDTLQIAKGTILEGGPIRCTVALDADVDTEIVVTIDSYT